MKIHQLRALLAIIECGSIQEASRQLHISQPALSKCIKDLEAELGTSLFIRSNRGIVQTDSGKLLARRARLVLKEMRRARDEIQALHGGMDGGISIGVSPVTPGKQFFTSLNSYRKRYPRVRVKVHELSPSRLMEGLREGMLDFVLTSSPSSLSRDGFQWTKLYSQPSVLTVRKGHPLQGVRQLQELRDQEWLLHDSLKSSRVGLMFEAYGIEPPTRIIECTSVVLFCEFALNTDVVSYWSRRLLGHVTTLGQQLHVLELQEQAPPMDISLVTRDQEALTCEAKGLVDEIMYTFSDLSSSESSLHDFQ